MAAKVQPSRPVSGSAEMLPDPYRFCQLDVDLKRATAMSYALRLGMAAFPVIDKQPASGAAWSSWTANPGVYDKSDAHWAAATGYALSPSRNSQMAIVDLDDPAFLPELLAAAPHLGNTFQVKRGDHSHFYIKLARPMTSALVSRKQNGHEVASVRAYGAYVVGPHSDHATGQSYIPHNYQVQQLSGYEQERLLALFVEARIPMPVAKQPTLPIAYASKPGITATPQWNVNKNASLVAKIADVLRANGDYKAHKDWLNGPCIHPENHVNGDVHSSFGVNMVTGVGHCFLCGSFSPRHVAQALERVLKGQERAIRLAIKSDMAR